MRLILCSLLALAACGDAPSDDFGADLSDAPASRDAASSNDALPAPGLSVTWNGQPPVPGPVATGVMITSVKLKIDRLEVIGDAGSTTDTTETDYDATWSATISPFPITFSNAPPGLYSKVAIRVDGKVVAPSYEILGTAIINGTSEPFRITDTAVLQVDVDGFDIALMPGRSMIVPIRVDFRDAIRAVDFAMLPAPGGVRTMNESTTGIAAVRTALEDSTFKRDN